MIYRYWFISEHRAEFGVKRLCQVLGLRRQGFHEWVSAEAAREAAAARQRELVAVIASIHAEHRRAYGILRITAELRRRGRVVNHKRVERLMREQGLAGITRRKRRSLTKADPSPAAAVQDLIHRDFTAEHPGQRFVGDITYLPVSCGSPRRPCSSGIAARSGDRHEPPQRSNIVRPVARTWSCRAVRLHRPRHHLLPRTRLRPPLRCRPHHRRHLATHRRRLPLCCPTSVGRQRGTRRHATGHSVADPASKYRAVILFQSS
ncbi:IS3 family transposase [Amycolatopsis keratiniphila]|uniref:IS3 family transposase n=1 Tax=Amycolatopsis keratiniphila TaxID=129921 RepID=UPI000F5042A6